MKRLLDKVFVFISYGIVSKSLIRSKTQMLLSFFVYELLLIGSFLLFKVINVSKETGSLLLLGSLGIYWLIVRSIDAYVNANWHLFRRPAMYRPGNVWAIRAGVYAIFTALIIGMSFSGYWWAKGH